MAISTASRIRNIGNDLLLFASAVPLPGHPVTISYAMTMDMGNKLVGYAKLVADLEKELEQPGADYFISADAASILNEAVKNV